MVLHFRIAKEAGLSSDAKTGELYEAYLRVDLGETKLEDEINEAQICTDIAALIPNMKPEWLTMISREEYEDNTDPNDDGCDCSNCCGRQNDEEECCPDCDCENCKDNE